MRKPLPISVDGGRIAISGGQIEHLAASYTKAWGRPPTEAKVKGLIDDWVREEVPVREALAAGLDRDDTIIRRRLRQKFEFLTEDALPGTPPTDRELQAWLAAHAGAFRIEPRVSLRQVFLNRDRRGAAAQADAGAILATQCPRPRGRDRCGGRPDDAARRDRPHLGARRRPGLRSGL